MSDTTDSHGMDMGWDRQALEHLAGMLEEAGVSDATLIFHLFTDHHVAPAALADELSVTMMHMQLHGRVEEYGR